MSKRKRTSQVTDVDSAPKLSISNKKDSTDNGSPYDHSGSVDDLAELSNNVTSSSNIHTSSHLKMTSNTSDKKKTQEKNEKIEDTTNLIQNNNKSSSSSSSGSGTAAAKIHIKDHASVIMPIVSAQDKWECKYVLSHVRSGNSGYCFAWLDTGFCPQTLINIGEQCSFIHKHPLSWDANQIQEHKKLQKMVKNIFNIESSMETKLVNCQLCESETNDLKQFYCSYLMDNRKLYNKPFTTLEGGESALISQRSRSQYSQYSTQSTSSRSEYDDGGNGGGVNSTLTGFLGGNDNSSCNFVSSDEGLSDFSDFDDLSTNDSIFSDGLY